MSQLAEWFSPAVGYLNGPEGDERRKSKERLSRQESEKNKRKQVECAWREPGGRERRGATLLLSGHYVNCSSKDRSLCPP